MDKVFYNFDTTQNFNYQWDFGNGVTSISDTPCVQYTDTGLYQITVYVFDTSAIVVDTITFKVYAGQCATSAERLLVTNNISDQTAKINIYPNPSSKYFTIVAIEDSEIQEFEVRNCLSQVIFTAMNINSQLTTFELNNFAGVYFINVKINEVNYIYKLILQ